MHGKVAHYSHVVMRGDNAELLTVSGPGQRSFNHFLMAPVYSLHFGDYGGLFVRLMYFALALLGCLLFFSGNIMWCERRTDRQGPSRSAAFMLRLTLGVTFGVMAGLAMAFIVSKPMVYSPGRPGPPRRKRSPSWSPC
ncbi:PepSY domain-containing protein [Alcanivorax sp. IO_7]|nr:PepSY domain-containing protein [Alcanivorax sp. IO_7]